MCSVGTVMFSSDIDCDYYCWVIPIYWWCCDIVVIVIDTLCVMILLFVDIPCRVLMTFLLLLRKYWYDWCSLLKYLTVDNVMCWCTFCCWWYDCCLLLIVILSVDVDMILFIEFPGIVDVILLYCGCWWCCSVVLTKYMLTCDHCYCDHYVVRIMIVLLRVWYLLIVDDVVILMVRWSDDCCYFVILFVLIVLLMMYCYWNCCCCIWYCDCYCLLFHCCCYCIVMLILFSTFDMLLILLIIDDDVIWWCYCTLSVLLLWLILYCVLLLSVLYSMIHCYLLLIWLIFVIDGIVIDDVVIVTDTLLMKCYCSWSIDIHWWWYGIVCIVVDDSLLLICYDIHCCIIRYYRSDDCIDWFIVITILLFVWCWYY